MKDAYYFSHDSNARNDEKILMLRAEHGWEGYGIYWALVEMMFENAETALDHSKVKGIAAGHNINITLLQAVITTCIKEELFDSDDTKFWSDSLRRRKQKYQQIKQQKSEAGKKGMAKRWGTDNTDITELKDTNNTDITKYNKGKERKGKESKGKENKRKETDTSLQIKNLRSRYSPEELSVIDEYFGILRFTRRSGRIADSVILKIYTEWEKFSIPKVIYALRTYISNPKHHDKQENYCYGIMRNAKAEEIETKAPYKTPVDDENYFLNRGAANGTRTTS